MLTHEQEEALKAMLDPQIQIVLINAKAGTGKTWLAVKAAYELHVREKKELLYTFSPVEEGRLGFLPGDVHDKTDPYTQPLKDALNSLGIKPLTAIYDRKMDESHMVNRGAWIKADSHVFMRGTNKENKTVIIDEAQNWTVSELKKMLTRCHDNTKIIMIGHTLQCDLPDPRMSGFEPYMYHFSTQPWAKKVNLTHNFRGRLAQWSDEIREVIKVVS